MYETPTADPAMEPTPRGTIFPVSDYAAYKEFIVGVDGIVGVVASVLAGITFVAI